MTKFLNNGSATKSFYENAQERFSSNIKGKIENVEDGIAVIGMAGRFPGANNVDEFWKNIVDGKETVSFFKKQELDNAVSEEEKNDENYVAVRGIIEDADKFDAPFLI